MARRLASWSTLAEMNVDLALVQEAGQPGREWAHTVGDDPELSWETTLLGGRGPWRAAVLQLSDRIGLGRRATMTLDAATAEHVVVSRSGSIAVADVTVDGRTAFTAVSVYAAWEKVGARGYADGSAHRILSDLSVLASDRRFQLVVAGDWNLLHGYGENGDPYWRARYDTVFDRAAALGLYFLGPRHPNGRQAEPWPAELPSDSLCVPTFHHSRQTPSTATRQLDFVFASASLVDRIQVRALNHPDEWGPSDHCRLLIEVDV
jgi:hypothetical protein